MSHYHAIVWIDHREARIFHFTPADADKIVVKAHSPNRHLHHRSGTRTGNHPLDDHRFFDAVVGGLQGAHDWLIVGPGNARTAFAKYIQERHATDAGRIVLVEALDHPTDGELLRLARKRAPEIDRMAAN